MRRHFKAWLAHDEGATAIEYALLASLIAVAIVASLSMLSTQLNTVFSEVATSLK